MKALVIVHPGSIYTSGASQVDPGITSQVNDDLVAAIDAADTIFVIDGMFSDGIPKHIDLMMMEAIDRSLAAGKLAARVWGCDAGELPYPGWRTRGEVSAFDGGSVVFDSQEKAAAAVIGLLADAAQIEVAGAWGTKDLSSGCATQVLLILKHALPDAEIFFSSGTLFEEDIDDAPQDMSEIAM